MITMGRVKRPLALVLAIIALLGAVVGLTGCSGDSVRASSDYAGEPKGVEAPASSAGGASWATWLQGGRQIGIVLYGSSTCPPRIQSIAVESATVLKATLAPVSGGVCTTDFAPHTTVFTTPSKLSTASVITVKLPDSTLSLPSLGG